MQCAMKTYPVIRPTALMCALLLTFAGCNSSENPAPEPPPPPVKAPFTITLTDLEATSVKATVTPDDDGMTYCAGPMTEAEYEACGGDVAGHVASIIRKAQESDPTIPVGEIVARLQRKGVTTQTYSGLQPRTKYYVMAIGLDDAGICTTPAAAETFTTPERTVPEGGFTLEVSDVTQTEATVSVRPDNDAMPYYFDVITAEDYRNCGGDLSVIMSELLAFLLENNPGRQIEEITAALQSLGPDSDRIGNMPPSTDFYAFAIGLGDDGVCLTEAAVQPFRTLDAGDPADCTFRIAVANNDSQSVLVEVTPSDNTVGYFTLVIDEADYAGDANLTARIRQSIEQVALEQGISVEQAVEAVCWRGVSKELWDGLTPSTGYYALAYAMNADASAAGPLTRERFTTLGGNVSAATCTIDCDKYFDGDALYALDPVRYANLAGRVYAPATARPSSDAAHWYIALVRGDLSDPVFYPDDETINALLQGGTPDIREMNYVADWGEATLLAVAADEYYQFGAVFRRQITFSREGASPVSELETASVLSAAQTGLLEAPAKVSRTTHDARAAVARRIRTAMEAPPVYRRFLPRFE